MPTDREAYSGKEMPVELPSTNEIVEGMTRRINRNPRDWLTRRERARLSISIDDYAAAEADLRFVIENAPEKSDVAQAHQIMGIGLLKQKAYLRAIDEFSAALKVAESADPKRPAFVAETLEWRATARFYAEQFDASLTDCDESEKSRKSSKIARIRAMCLVKKREWQQALEVLDESPADVGGLMLRAFALAGLRRQGEASAAIALARSMDEAETARWENFVQVEKAK